MSFTVFPPLAQDRKVLRVVQHGDDPNHPRPLGGPVVWQGLADPVNKRIGDMWIEIDPNV